jgi:hypothetical protein
MRRLAGIVLTTGIALAVCATTASARSGSESFDGVIVASGISGARTVVSSPVVARGVFEGVGRIVEVENLPTDPDTVLRDDLVFRAGVLHLVSEGASFDFTLDPRSCIFRLSGPQTSTIEGGTGRFQDAQGSFAGTIRAHGLAAREPDRSCSQQQAPIAEVDKLSSTGVLSF